MRLLCPGSASAFRTLQAAQPSAPDQSLVLLLAAQTPEVQLPPHANELHALGAHGPHTSSPCDDANLLRVHLSSLAHHEVGEARGELVAVVRVDQVENVALDQVATGVAGLLEELLALYVCYHDLPSRDVADQARGVAWQLHLQYAAHVKLPLVDASVARLGAEGAGRGDKICALLGARQPAGRVHGACEALLHAQHALSGQLRRPGLGVPQHRPGRLDP
mmetsp:Transcript_108599/g.350587  ORF Transcript_108599/g.350587 Transcript_108599/m.350587 type:complete len:220 (-) Transcript_108599:2346-3005(-)